METKSRVIKYEKYRKKISKIDVPLSDENQIEKKHLNNDVTVNVKTNNLTLSIDELLIDDETYREKKRKEEQRKKYIEKKKRIDKVLSYMPKWKLLILVVTPFLIVFITLLILIILEVI